MPNTKLFNSNFITDLKAYSCRRPYVDEYTLNHLLFVAIMRH